MTYLAKIRAALLDAPLSAMQHPAFARLTEALDELSTHSAHQCSGCYASHVCESRAENVRCHQWAPGIQLLEHRARLGAALALEVMG